MVTHCAVHWTTVKRRVLGFTAIVVASSLTLLSCKESSTSEVNTEMGSRPDSFDVDVRNGDTCFTLLDADPFCKSQASQPDPVEAVQFRRGGGTGQVGLLAGFVEGDVTSLRFASTSAPLDTEDAYLLHGVFAVEVQTDRVYDRITVEIDGHASLECYMPGPVTEPYIECEER